MALDSTGDHWNKTVPCFLCAGNPIELDIYKPERGYCAEELNLPPCMEPHNFGDSVIMKAKFFQIEKFGEPPDEYEVQEGFVVNFVPYVCEVSSEAYHYNGCFVPDFGENVGQVVFVCEQCIEEHGNELPFTLAKKFCRNIGQEIENWLVKVLVLGILQIDKDAMRNVSLDKLSKRRREIKRILDNMQQMDGANKPGRISQMQKHLVGLKRAIGNLSIEQV